MPLWALMPCGNILPGGTPRPWQRTHPLSVIAKSAAMKQSRGGRVRLDCFVAFVLNQDFYKINKITRMFLKIPVIRKILLESWFKIKISFPLSVIAKSAAMKQSGNTPPWIASLLRASQ
jgi:hypothetical protein